MHNITAYTARKWLVEMLFRSTPVLLRFWVKITTGYNINFMAVSTVQEPISLMLNGRLAG